MWMTFLCFSRQLELAENKAGHSQNTTDSDVFSMEGIIAEDTVNIDDRHEEALSMQSEISMIVSSDGNSITYPYQSLLKDTTFPRCHLMARPGCRAETYSGCLRMLGHGTPLWVPVVDPNDHLNSGVCIGDVGFLDPLGFFETIFNLFLPPDHPAQPRCPKDLIPLDPPLPEELVVDPTYFPPGTVLVSKGIEASTLSSSPLDIKFTVKTREGGMLVLPDGATREDLRSTTQVREYVQKHALSWYVFANKGLGAVMHPNCSLYVVTGTDKSTTWANCVTYPRESPFRRLWEPSEIIYHGAREDAPHYWESSRKIRTALSFQRSREIEHVGTCALFIRGIRFGVNVRDWTEHLLHYNPPEVTPFTLIRTAPIVGLRAKIQTLKECLPGYTQMIPTEEGLSVQVIFHPIDVLLRLILEESPSSNLAYLEDRIFSSVADKSHDADMASIVRLLAQILASHELLVEEDKVTLVPRKAEPTTEHATPTGSYPILRFVRYIGKQYRVKRQRWEILNRISKVFPGPGVPHELLEPLRT